MLDQTPKNLILNTTQTIERDATEINETTAEGPYGNTQELAGKARGFILFVRSNSCGSSRYASSDAIPTSAHDARNMEFFSPWV